MIFLICNHQSPLKPPNQHKKSRQNLCTRKVHSLVFFSSIYNSVTRRPSAQTSALRLGFILMNPEIVLNNSWPGSSQDSLVHAIHWQSQVG